MIFRWMAQVWRRFLMIFIPPPGGRKPKKINLNSVCPSCGHGPLTVKTVIITANPNRPSAMRKAQHRWTCRVCECWFYTDPLMGTDADKLHGVEVQGL